MVEVGFKGRAESIVNQTNTAKTIKSGSLDVLATPIMAALMEEAAVNALDLPDDQTSVGTSLEIKHMAATPIGMKIWSEAEVVEVEGRKVTYTVQAFDEKEKIGEGQHQRFIVDIEKFMLKADSKLVLR